VAIAEDVKKLRDEERVSFDEIARRLEVDASTVTRAYDHSHRRALLTAADQGMPPNPGHMATFLDKKGEEIRGLLGHGLPVPEIASRVGSCQQIVHRLRKAILTEQPGA
jgi:hypothetical protein